MSEIVEALVRAAATKLVRETRQFWLFGLKPGDPLRDNFSAANKICYWR